MNTEKLAHLRRYMAARLRSLRHNSQDTRTAWATQAIATAMLIEARNLAKLLPREKR